MLWTYGITAWGNADKNIIKPAILLQKRAICVINNAPYNSHTDPKFKKSGILKLNDLFDYQSLLFISDYICQIIFQIRSTVVFPQIGTCTQGPHVNQNYCTYQHIRLNMLNDSLCFSCLNCGMNGTHCYQITHQDIGQNE